MDMKARIDQDIRYVDPADDPEGVCFLDLYRPEQSSSPIPVVVVIHGGGWFSQSRKGKRERSIASDLADAGYAAASIDYPLLDLDRPEACRGLWPRNLTRCKDAVKFLRNHAGEYGIDPSRIGTIGGSAGAHLAAMLGLTGTGESSVAAVVYLYGVCDIARWCANALEPRLGMRAAEIMLDGTPAERPEAYLHASPVGHLEGTIPPMLLIHGDSDDTIPYTETTYFQSRLKEAGADSKLIIVPGAPHSFDLHPDGMDLVGPVVAFFDRCLRDS